MAVDKKQAFLAADPGLCIRAEAHWLVPAEVWSFPLLCTEEGRAFLGFGNLELFISCYPYQLFLLKHHTEKVDWGRISSCKEKLIIMHLIYLRKQFLYCHFNFTNLIFVCLFALLLLLLCFTSWFLTLFCFTWQE